MFSSFEPALLCFGVLWLSLWLSLLLLFRLFGCLFGSFCFAVVSALLYGHMATFCSRGSFHATEQLSFLGDDTCA